MLECTGSRVMGLGVQEGELPVLEMPESCSAPRSPQSGVRVVFNSVEMHIPLFEWLDIAEGAWEWPTPTKQAESDHISILYQQSEYV